MIVRPTRLPWAQEAPRFKSGRPDQNIFCVFFSLLKAPFTPKTYLWNSGRQEVSIRNSFNAREFTRVTNFQKHAEAGVPFRNY
jgi:hypothetical protein